MTERTEMAEVMTRVRAAHERFWADLGEFLTDEAITELREAEARATEKFLGLGRLERDDG